MKRTLIYTLIGLAFTNNVFAQNMRELVRTMPDSILPLLTRNDRLDFIDYLDSNMKAEVTNKMGGKSEMTEITGDYAHINISKNSEIAFKLLPYEKDSIICTIHTFSSTASESRLRFYTIKWEELRTEDFIKIPSTDEFFIPTDTLTQTDYKNLHNKLDICLIKAKFNEESTALILTLTTPLYLSEENRKTIAPYLKQSIIKKWNGKRFE